MVRCAGSIRDETSVDQECNSRPQLLSQGTSVVNGVQLDVVGEADGVDSHGQDILPPGFPIPTWYYNDGLSVIFLEFLNDLSQKMKRGVYPQLLSHFTAHALSAKRLKRLFNSLQKASLAGTKSWFSKK